MMLLLFLLAWMHTTSQAFNFSRVDPDTISLRRQGEWLLVEREGMVLERVPLEKVEGGTEFYHWADEASAKMYGATGRISPAQIEGMNVVKDQLQVYGPGFYVSRDAFNARTLGDRSVQITAPEGGFYVLKEIQSRGEMNFFRTVDFKKLVAKLAEQGVLGSGLGKENRWYVFYDPRATTSVKPFDNTTYLRNVLRNVAKLTPEQQVAARKLEEGKAWDAQDIVALARKEGSPFTESQRLSVLEELQRKAEAALAKGAGNKQEELAARTMLLSDKLFSQMMVRGEEVKADFDRLAAVVSRPHPPEEWKVVLPELNRILPTMAENYEKMLSAGAARPVVAAAKADPSLLQEAVSFVGAVTPSKLPAVLSGLLAREDSRLTQDFAELLGVPKDTARLFRELMVDGGYMRTAGVREGMDKVKLTSETAEALVRAGGSSSRALRAALMMAGKVERPSPALLELFLEGLLNRNESVWYYAWAALKKAKLQSPELRGKMLPRIRRWLEVNKGNASATKNMVEILNSSGLSLEDVKNAKDLTGDTCAGDFASLARGNR